MDISNKTARTLKVAAFLSFGICFALPDGLTDAIASGNRDAVETALKHASTQGTRDHLNQAIELKNPEIVQLLIEHGVGIPDHKRDWPLRGILSSDDFTDKEKMRLTRAIAMGLVSLVGIPKQNGRSRCSKKYLRAELEGAIISANVRGVARHLNGDMGLIAQIIDEFRSPGGWTLLHMALGDCSRIVLQFPVEIVALLLLAEDTKPILTSTTIIRDKLNRTPFDLAQNYKGREYTEALFLLEHWDDSLESEESVESDDGAVSNNNN